MEFRHDAALSADGSLAGTIEMRGKGAIDGRLRSFVTSQRQRDLSDACAGMGAVVSDAIEVSGCDHLDPYDFSQPMWVRFRYRIPGYALPVAGGLEFQSPMMRIVTDHWVPFRAAAIEWAEERTTDLLLYFTQRFEGVETIRLPAGYAMAKPPEMDGVDETYASFSGRCAAVGGKLEIRGEGELRRRQIPPDGYPGMKRAMDAARAWADATYRVEKGGAR